MQWKSRPVIGLFFLTAFGFAACLATLGLTGCKETSAPTVAPPPKYGRVRVACPERLGAAVVKPYGRNWERQTDGEIELVSYDPQKSEPPDADIWLLPAAAMPRGAAAGKLHTLPESISASSDYLWRTLLPLYSETLIRWDRKRYALPVLGESLLCCYRRDWLTDPRHQEAFLAKYGRKLEPPATWEQFADIAEYFSQARKEPSLPPLPAAGDELERIFYTIAANYAGRAIADSEVVRDERPLFSFQYDIGKGTPRIAGGGFVHALKLMQRLQACRPPGEAKQPADAFADGQAVFCLVETAQLAEFQDKAKVKNQFSICLMPGSNGYYEYDAPQKWSVHEHNRIPYLGAGSWLGVVPQSAADAEAAFSLLAYLSSPAVSKQIVIDPRIGGGPTRQEHLHVGSHWEAFGLDESRTAKVKDALTEMQEHLGLKNPAMCLRTPDEAAHRLALEEELRAALQGTKTPEQALHDAAARWTQLDEKKGLEAIRAEYRLSVGLLGKE